MFVQIAGVQSDRLLTACLYTIDDPEEIGEIVCELDPEELIGATQRKATNWLMFTLRDRMRLKTDFDEEAGELRVTTNESIREYRIGAKASERLNRHIKRARARYEEAYRDGR